MAVSLLSLTVFGNREAAAECWSYESSAEVIGVATDGTFVIHTRSYTEAGGGDQQSYIFVGADGSERARLERCDDETECDKKSGQWQKHGQAALLQRLTVSKAIAVKAMGEQIQRVLALTPPTKSSLAVQDSNGDDDNIKLYLRNPAGHIALMLVSNPETDGNLRLRVKQLYEHPSSHFLFLQFALKGSCYLGENRSESQVEGSVEVIPRGRIDAMPLVTDGKHAQQADVAIDKLHAALLLDPNNIATRKLLVDALLAAKKPWSIAKPLLNVPFVRRSYQTYFGGKIEALDNQDAPTRWPEYSAWLAEQTKSYNKASASR